MPRMFILFVPFYFTYCTTLHRFARPLVGTCPSRSSSPTCSSYRWNDPYPSQLVWLHTMENHPNGQPRRGAVACTGKRHSLDRRAASKPAPMRGRLRSGRALMRHWRSRATLIVSCGKRVLAREYWFWIVSGVVLVVCKTTQLLHLVS